MNILVDRHQADLFYSLQILFEDRLGLQVYTPVGFEWYDQEYWNFGRKHFGRELANQYLGIDAAYHEVLDRVDRIEYWETTDPAHLDRPIRCVTKPQFDAMGDFSHICATVQDNQHGFKRLADEIGAKYVYQVGNTNQQIDWSLDPIALISGEEPILGRGLNMHQPFDMQETFRYREPVNSKLITSWVNCMPRISGTCWPTLLSYREALPEFEFRIYGICLPEEVERWPIVKGNVHPVEAIADEMAASRFVWHCKAHGDGFGHVLHNAAAVGRPLIGEAGHYKGKMPEHIWKDLTTCIDLEQRSFDENVALIRKIADDPVKYGEMSRAIRSEVEHIDWAGEAAQIGRLLA